ncbi:MAG: hypothetical protein DAHOPDDO_00507 [Ignavibacteriaceae bacterium]|nr:hypothetical protein [Ignavibacteriaceae bacterium]
MTGLLAGTLTITHNASGSPTVYSVQGIGIEAFSSSLNLLNLVNVITSSIVDTQFTVTNNGTVPLLMNTNITDAPNWNISPDTVLIPAGSNFIFTLTFSAPAMPTTFADTLTLSTVGFPSLKIPLSANVVSDAGIIFELDSVYKLEDNSYMEIMQLKNLTDSLHAFQFRIQVNKEISDNVILIFQNIQKGTDVADASWILRSTITRGPITPNGASMDEVFVLLYNINQGAGLAPGNYNNLFRVNYTVADLEPLQDSLKSTFRITHVEGSDYQGLPIDITPSRDLLNVIARNRVSWRGDVNSDGYLDVLDLIMVVDHIVNVDSLNATEFFRADIAPWLPGHSAPVPDGIVNVQELSLIQNIILTGHYPDGTPIGPVAKANYSMYNGDEDAKITLHISKKGIESSINSTIGIRGVQLELSNVESNPGSMIINTDLGRGFFFYAEENKILRTLLYDPLGEKYIEQGEHFLAEMPFTLDKPENVTIEKIVVVDVNREKLEKIQVEIIYSNQVELPENYALFQNYPNPFNPGTVIEFTLPEDVSNAKLSIYNALGEKVAELVNTSLQAGYHSYYWNAKDFATGMYIYELRTDKFVSVKKMVLVK